MRLVETLAPLPGIQVGKSGIVSASRKLFFVLDYKAMNYVRTEIYATTVRLGRWPHDDTFSLLSSLCLLDNSTT